MALIGVGGLLSFEDLKKALNTGYADFIGVGRALMLNKDLGILLKEGKTDKIILEIDPDHPEKFDFPKMLWGMSIQKDEWYDSDDKMTYTIELDEILTSEIDLDRFAGKRGIKFYIDKDDAIMEAYYMYEL